MADQQLEARILGERILLVKSEISYGENYIANHYKLED